MADNKSKLFSVGKFAKLSLTTLDKLRNYDKIGLLSPALRQKNRYRYYSSGQLAALNLIRTLQELGMTLTDIKTLSDQRTPELTDKVLLEQIGKIDKKIVDWGRARKLLFTLHNTIHSVLDIDENELTVKQLPAEAIILGDINDYSKGRNDYDALFDFYHSIKKRYPTIDLNYPVWAIFSEERIRRGDCILPDRFYFYNPEGHDKRPAGLYAIGYERSGYGGGGRLYKRMLDYIDDNKLEVCGDAYEEYPFNEVCISDNTNYLKRVLITVRKKTKTRGQ